MIRILLIAAVFCVVTARLAHANCTEEIERGVASWYGPGFEGASTSSADIFDPSLLSAAHPDLPMGTVVRIVNMRNHREAVVKINDRGGFGHERVIDVSEGAAAALGMIEDGTAAVTLYRCND